MNRIAILVSILFSSLSFADETTENQIFYDVYSEIDRQLGEKSSLTYNEIDLSLKHVIRHPVATILDPQITSYYDPTGAIGFCFGRALATQLAARRLGLKSEFVKKIFIIGDMRSGAVAEWRFHVTTIVKGSDGKWYAIDPIAPGGKPITAEQWLKWVRQVWDKPGKTNAYVTSGDVMIPNILKVPESGAENNTEIMSTTFRPETHKGVIKLSQAERFYDVSGVEAAEFQEKQFISTKEAERFNAAEITINNSLNFKYNKYFSDLMEVFKTTTKQDILTPKRNVLFSAKSHAERLQMESTAKRNEIGSMRFDLINSQIDWNECFY